MIPVHFEGAVETGKPKGMTDEQCMSIPAAFGIDGDGLPYFLTAWKPSYEDMQALQRGEPIYIKTVATALPPMALFTLDENSESN